MGPGRQRLRGGREARRQLLGPSWAGALAGPRERQRLLGWRGKKRASSQLGQREGEAEWAKSKGRKEKGNLFLFNFSKAVQNTISTQIEIRLQIKQYKMLCNSMNAHSLLLALYLVLFLIKLLFSKFKFPQNAELIIFSYFQKYEKFRVLQFYPP